MLRNKIQGVEATDPNFPQLSLAERRQKLRVRTYIRLQVRSGEASASAIVTDLSIDGMRLRTNLEIEEGVEIEVIFPEQSDIDPTGTAVCRVIWVKPLGAEARSLYEVGLTFKGNSSNLRSSWVRYVLEQLGFDEKKIFQKRRYLRAGGKLPARIFTIDQKETISGEVLNLGVGGALLASTTKLPKGAQINCEVCLWRILPALRLSCKIMEVRQDSTISPDETYFLYSLIFLGMDTEQVKLLGNYIIFLINQAE